MKYFALVAALATLAGPALAQEKTDNKPLTLSVRPSGYSELSDDPRTRQERLMKQMEENDFKFRSICMQCGDKWKHNTYAPFDPQSVLNARKRASAE
ncbi:hypothetical protein [Microvirga flavescens]|uniref:hypothetical protein n=1 Tax=Microvirga flavescens TaxID=2249811 RepID=UPI000DD9FBA7|nr:hypothetical protein [Microvirga flavescens]